MKYEKPYWYKVLEHFEKNRYFYNGLTIPFLIGSRTIIEPQNGLLSIRELFEEFYNEMIAIPVTIMTCGNINELIVSLLDNETNLMQQQYPKLYTEFGNLICTDQSFDDFFTFSQIVTQIEERYSDKIQNGFYSKNDGEWVEFTNMDIKRLNEINLSK